MSPYNDKIKQLAAYIQKNSSDSFSKFALALELIKQDEVQKAIQLFENIYRSDPDYLGVYYHLGKLYESELRYEDAKKRYEEGIELAKRQQNLQTETELKEALALLIFEIDDD